MVLISIQAVLGTTFFEGPGASSLSTYCQVKVKFLGERFKSSQIQKESGSQTFYRVFWDFGNTQIIDALNSPCPNSQFSIMIRGSSFNPFLDNHTQYIYPVEIQSKVPRLGDLVKLKIHFFNYNDPILHETYEDWRIENFSNDMEIIRE